MKICLMPHPNTAERFSNLSATLREQADIAICFPQEDFDQMNADVFILEEEIPTVTQRLLSLERVPLIVYPKAGISTKQIRYLSDFPRQFPKLLQELPNQNHTVCFKYKNQFYRYRQENILYLHEKRSLRIYFRQGTQIDFRLSLNKISKQLSPAFFFAAGDDLLVNAEYVCEITERGIRLENGQEIPIDSTMAEQVKNAYFKTKYLSHCAKI